MISARWGWFSGSAVYRVTVPASAAPANAPKTLRDAVARFEAWYLSHALERNQNRRIVTAKELGITRECLYKKLRRYGLQ